MKVDRDIQDSFSDLLRLELVSSFGEEHIDDNIRIFWDIFMAEETQNFLEVLSGKEVQNNLGFLVQDVLLWTVFGYGPNWTDRKPIMPPLQEISLDSLNWADWISYNDSSGHTLVNAIRSPNFYPERVLDFGTDKDTMQFYGYDPSAGMQVKGMDCIQHITLHHTAGHLIQSVNTLTDPNRKSSGQLNRVSANFLVASSGITYALVPYEYAAWHAGSGRCFDYDPRIVDFRSLPGNYNMYSIGIEIVDVPLWNTKNIPNEFSSYQVSRVSRLCTELYQLIKTGGDFCGQPGDHIVSHGEVDPQRKRDVNWSFPWHVLADQGLIDLPQVQCADYDSVLYSYQPGKEVSCKAVAQLRHDLRMVGIPANITGDVAKDELYDVALARCCWQFKAKYMGYGHPEVCSLDPKIAWAEGDKDMNLDWQNAAEETLKRVISNRYGHC